MYFQFAQTFSVFFLNFMAIFVMGASKIRNTYLSYVHIGATLLTFLILPVCTVLISIIGLAAFGYWNTGIGVWTLTYAIAMLIMAFWTPNVIKPAVDDVWSQYKLDLADEEDDREVEPYFQRERD